MTPEEYMVAKTAAVAAAVRAAQRAASLAAGSAISQLQWIQLLQTVFPEVERRRTEVASLARTFYDTERAKAVPSAPRNERLLEGTDFQVFARNMEPAKRRVLQAEAPRDAVTHFTMRVAREIEIAGRNQIIHAIEEDPYLDDLLDADEPEDDQVDIEEDTHHTPVVSLAEHRLRRSQPSNPRLVKGWARVATGRETCAWCLMLISRGPVYSGPDAAGLDLDDTTTIDLWNEAGQDLSKFRELVDGSLQEWHAGCDCVVVPVFDTANWVGKEAWEQAEKLWIDAGKEADERIASGEARTNNTNKETLNALRRRLYRGEISIPSYAFAA
ncbi:capsid maturation protease [Mycobacterium phage PainterBoy]|nr:capsid maturation protease [Mycobacterium phage Lucyedi]QNJ55809.1 capsid maturation protease [Mycobacterium phage PainterBoy]